MAYHYSWCKCEDSNPILFRYDWHSEVPYEDLINIMIEYNGTVVHITEPNELFELIGIFDDALGIEREGKLIPDSDYNYIFCTELFDDTEGLIKFTVYPKGETLDYYNYSNVFYVRSYGRIVCRLSNYVSGFIISAEEGGVSVGFGAHRDLLSVDTFPVDKLIFFIRGLQ